MVTAVTAIVKQKGVLDRVNEDAFGSAGYRQPVARSMDGAMSVGFQNML